MKKINKFFIVSIVASLFFALPVVQVRAMQEDQDKIDPIDELLRAQREQNKRSIAWQLIDQASDQGFKLGNLSEQAEKSTKFVSNNDRFLIKKVHENAVIVQVPVAEQESNECGINALAMTDVFCVASYDAKDIGTVFTSDNFKPIVGFYRDSFIDYRKKESNKEDEDAAWMSYEEMFYCNNNKFVNKQGGVYRSIIKLSEQDVKGLGTSNNIVREAVVRWLMGGENPLPEVFVVYLEEEKHWVALRIERMPNGMTAAIFGDSLSYESEKSYDVEIEGDMYKITGEEKKKDKTARYKKFLAPLVKLFA